MTIIEIYSDNKGNTITIEQNESGVTVSANIETKPKYTDGANASAARAYAQKYGLRKISP